MRPTYVDGFLRMPSVWARPSGHALPTVVHTRLLAFRLPSDAILQITLLCAVLPMLHPVGCRPYTVYLPGMPCATATPAPARVHTELRCLQTSLADAILQISPGRMMLYAVLAMLHQDVIFLGVDCALWNTKTGRVG